MTYDATENVNLSYDQENRITGAAGYTYTYDDDGNRVRKSNGNLAGNGTLYWYMTPGIVAETDLAGTTKSEYIFFDGERIARRDGVNGAGGVFYYFSDHLKTASIITDASGAVKAESDYYPWGGELQITANDSNHYKFTGKERDSETGLDYFGARYYSNGLGRFITPDWSAKPAAVPYAALGDPQTLNLYEYVRNIPTTRYDVDGHCFPFCLAPALAGGGTLAAEGGGIALLSNPVGWTILGVAAVGTIGYIIYEHFHSKSSNNTPPPTAATSPHSTPAVPPPPPPPNQNLNNQKGTNKRGQKTSRSTLRKGTVRNAWNNAQDGPNGGKLCPDCGTEVKVNPDSGQLRDWDVNHDPS